MVIGLGILDQRQEVERRLHQTNTEQLREEEPQLAGAYLEKITFGNSSSHCATRDPGDLLFTVEWI